MKTFFSFLTLIVVLFSMISCSKDQDVEVQDLQSLKAEFKQLSETPATESYIITDVTKPFISKIDSKKLELLTQIRQLSDVSILGWVGPNFVAGTLTQIYAGQAVQLVAGESPTLPAGIYYCDIYALRATVTLPAGTVARVDFDQMPKIGYSNWQQKIQGVAFQQSVGPSGNILEMVMYSILPRYNVIGQQVSSPALPAGDLTGAQFAYSYFE